MRYLRLGFLALVVCLVEAQTKQSLAPAVGIDLGTTYSCVAYYHKGKVEIITNDQGNRVTPSVVAFTDTERLVGDAAKTVASLYPANTVYDVKRLIGRTFSDSHVKADAKLWPFKLTEGADQKPMIEVTVKGAKKQFDPESISAMVLTKMKETAEKYIGQTVNNIVVTVPAYFNDAQRQATKDAGTVAGLNVLRIINEPTAAAIAYGLDRKGSGSESTNVLVFDLGGGTFDVSVLSIDNGVFEVLATAGDTHLGGEDFDNRIMSHFIKTFKQRTKKDLSTDKKAVQKLRREVERAKRALSTQPQVRLEIESLMDGYDFNEQLTRAKFEDLCVDLFKKTIKPVQRVLDDASLGKSEVDEIILVGGSTRIPKVQSIISEFFGGKTLSKSVNPDEAVAHGAAVQAAILSGVADEKSSDLLLLDVTPLSLGIETTGGLTDKLIPRNTVIPTSKTKQYTTSEDNQRAVTNKVYEGERKLSKDCNLLGQFELSGFPAMPKGQAQIEVTFNVDANGILKVSAREQTSNTEGQITISNRAHLSEQDIERMVQEAEEFAEEDKKAEGKVTAIHALESYLYTVRSELHKVVEKAGEEKGADAAQLEQILEDVNDWLDEHQDAETEDYEEKLEELKSACDPLLEGIAGSTSGSAASSDDDDDAASRDEL